MRWAIACLGLFGAACTPALAWQPTAPYAPLPDVPDYVVTMAGNMGYLRPPNYVRTVTHHGASTRVENKSAGDDVTGYFRPPPSAEMYVHRMTRTGDEIVAVSVADVDRRWMGWYYVPRNTGERQTLLGETCTVWQVGHGNFSCITDDGIELWSKVVDYAGTTLSEVATRIERRPVAPDEVRPPRELLNIDRWLPPSRASADTNTQGGGDYEVVMRGYMNRSMTMMTQLSLTTRRHGEWTYIETSGDVRRRLTVSSRAARLKIDFAEGYRDRPRRLSIERLPDEVRPAVTPRDQNRSEQILGESCEWFDLAPFTSDADLWECRTSDGIALKSTAPAGDAQMFSAERVSRRPLRLDEVMPPPPLLDPKSWGLD